MLIDSTVHNYWNITVNFTHLPRSIHPHRINMKNDISIVLLGCKCFAQIVSHTHLTPIRCKIVQTHTLTHTHAQGSTRSINICIVINCTCTQFVYDRYETDAFRLNFYIPPSFHPLQIGAFSGSVVNRVLD